MASMVIWMLGIGLSVAALVLAAALKHFYVHMVLAAIIGLFIAFVSHQDVRRVETGPMGGQRGIEVALRHMGFVWVWGALGLLATYAFGILTWREWWQFCIGFMLLAGLCLFLASTMGRDAETGVADVLLTKVARGFAIFILVAMIITMVGLLIDGKMWRYFTRVGQRPGSQDWGANNIFFFGALAQALISTKVITLTGAQLSKVE